MPHYHARPRDFCYTQIASHYEQPATEIAVALNTKRGHLRYCKRPLRETTAYFWYSSSSIKPPISLPVCPGFMRCERMWQWSGYMLPGAAQA